MGAEMLVVEEGLKQQETALTGADMRVLIAEDSPTSRRVLEITLRKWGYHVQSVPDGSQAWEVLQRDDAPRLAILDWMMPGLSGPEVCREVRRLTRAHYTYILLLTSRSEKEDLIEGLEAGADDYITKPFDSAELKVRLGPGQRILELQGQLLAAQEALRDQATRDALTRLWNRRAILEIFEKELARARREGVPLGVVMGDLDKFKSLNDTYGHLAGDTVLREVGARMQNSLRPYDALGRYGGEEFIMVLPGCDQAATEALSERMRASIDKEPVDLGQDGGPIRATISLGCTSVPPSNHATVKDLIRAADEALYQAKKSGRNRVVYAPMPVAEGRSG